MMKIFSHGGVDKNNADDESKIESIEADKVLVTVGRKPRSQGLENTGVKLDERGFCHG